MNPQKITVLPEVKTYADMFNTEHEKNKVLEAQLKTLADENQNLKISLADVWTKNSVYEMKMNQIRKLSGIKKED